MPCESTLEIPRKVWTRDEAHLLADLGFPNAAKLELVDGELIDHTGKTRPHVIWQHLIHEWLQATFGAEYVEMGSVINVAAEDNRLSEPEPDLILTAKGVREYETNPSPGEIRLLVEVSDSTVSYDLRKKAPIYARAEIMEYWVVDLPGKLVHVHREPRHGRYASIVKFGFEEAIRPLAKHDAAICMNLL